MPLARGGRPGGWRVRRARSEGDLLHIYREVEAAGAAFRPTFLPPAFSAPQASAFDREYVAALFEAGRDDARNGIAWLDPPSP